MNQCINQPIIPWMRSIELNGLTIEYANKESSLIILIMNNFFCVEESPWNWGVKAR